MLFLINDDEVTAALSLLKVTAVHLLVTPALSLTVPVRNMRHYW